MINAATLSQVQATLPELLPKLVDNLAREGQTYVDNIAAASENGDWDTVNQNAHPLKSMAKHMGADELAEISETIEDDPEAAPDLISALRNRYVAARDAALQFLTQYA